MKRFDTNTTRRRANQREQLHNLLLPATQILRCVVIRWKSNPNNETRMSHPTAPTSALARSPPYFSMPQYPQTTKPHTIHKAMRNKAIRAEPHCCLFCVCCWVGLKVAMQALCSLLCMLYYYVSLGVCPCFCLRACVYIYIYIYISVKLNVVLAAPPHRIKHDAPWHVRQSARPLCESSRLPLNDIVRRNCDYSTCASLPSHSPTFRPCFVH